MKFYAKTAAAYVGEFRSMANVIYYFHFVSTFKVAVATVTTGISFSKSSELPAARCHRGCVSAPRGGRAVWGHGDDGSARGGARAQQGSPRGAAGLAELRAFVDSETHGLRRALPGPVLVPSDVAGQNVRSLHRVPSFATSVSPGGARVNRPPPVACPSRGERGERGWGVSLLQVPSLLREGRAARLHQMSFKQVLSFRAIGGGGTTDFYQPPAFYLSDPFPLSQERLPSTAFGAPRPSQRPGRRLSRSVALMVCPPVRGGLTCPADAERAWAVPPQRVSYRCRPQV